MTVRDLWVGLAASAATLLCSAAVPYMRGDHYTTTGRAKAKGENAFVLSVGLEFQNTDDAKELLAAWSKAADYCIKHEPFLYAYEVAHSDQYENKYVIIERYRSKEDYTGAHRQSSAFHAFRPIMRELQNAGKVKVTGQSYTEMGIGFT